MEYFVGALITLIVMVTTSKMFVSKIPAPKQTVSFTQSRLFEMTMDAVEFHFAPKKIKKTQSSDFFAKTSTRILYMDSHAYWIKDNAFYVANVVDGEVQKDLAEKVDIMSMDKVELDKMIFIIEKLTEGLSNDSGNSGN